jgi:hypothetical protein
MKISHSSTLVLALISSPLMLSAQTGSNSSSAGTPPKLWRNGKYIDLNEEKLTFKPEGVTINEAIDLASNGIILATATESGVKKTGLLVPTNLKKCWETSNKANQLFNKTKKDDATGNTSVIEKEGDATYCIPRNKLYVVEDAIDHKFKVSLDVEIPEKFRDKFIAAAYYAGSKVTDSDKPFPSDEEQPAQMEIPVTGGSVREYEIKFGYDKNKNSLLDTDEAMRIEVYKRKTDNQPRYLTVKGISEAKYQEHKEEIEGKISFLGQAQPTFPAKYARSFLALFYYKGVFSYIQPSVVPSFTTTLTLDAFAHGQGFAEWLTHNSGAEFSDEGVTSIKEYRWAATSEVSEFFAYRTPFALEATMNNSQGYYEFATDTGTALKNFYNANVKASAELALQNAQIGSTVTFPADGGWYNFPNEDSPSLFKSDSPQTSASWVTPATMVVGKNDNYSGFSALFTDILAGTEEFNDFDAFGVVGRGRVLGPKYQITVKKEQTGTWPFQSTVYNVSSVLFECAIEDLYDFNYEDGELPSHAAAMQIGYGKGAYGETRDQGLIYRHRINIRHAYPYPFNQTINIHPPQ